MSRPGTVWALARGRSRQRRTGELPAEALADLGPALRVIAGGAPQDFALVADRGGGTGHVLERYAVVPSLANPRVLLPLDATAAALGAALAQHGAGASSALARAAARTLRAASRIGVAHLLLRDRIAVTVARQDLPRTHLHDFLAEVLGRADFATSMRIAPRRPNGKPVVQAVAPDGTVLAYAKFGWDSLTRRLIRHEATVLGDLACRTDGLPLRVPRVLHGGRWHGLETIVLTPVHGRPQRPRSPSDLPIGALIAIASVRQRFRQPLGESRFWRRTVDQVALIGPQLGECDRGIVQRACDLIESRWGATQLPFGQSHGDWIPPNMSISEDGILNVWDWERSRSDVPLGIDAMQFILYVVLQRPLRAWSPADRLVGAGRAALSRHGLDPGTSAPLLMLSLLRSVLWYGEARHAGRREHGERRYIRLLDALLDRCRSTVSAQSVRRADRSAGTA